MNADKEIKEFICIHPCSSVAGICFFRTSKGTGSRRGRLDTAAYNPRYNPVYARKPQGHC